ncbi:MAG: metal-dependent hydrolase [Betaproteobacteria bacterium]|nr:metal-dependent hydrolase [Betaproteobacteria bacterium]
MPTIFSHVLASAAIGTAVLPRGLGIKPVLIGMTCAIIPDLDVLAFSLGIPYSHPFGHRGFTHSLVFAALLAFAALWVFYREPMWARYRRSLCAFLLLCVAFHGVLDALTNGGLGVAFFWPIDHGRYFFPVTPIKVSPIGAGFFSDRGLETIYSELVWVGIPSALIIAFCAVRHRKRDF